MAQINLTLNQEEILQLLSENREESFRQLLQKTLNEVIRAESTEVLGAAPGQRMEERSDYRNGTRERELTTRIGTITLQVPRHRGQPFHSMVLDAYSRSEASLIATMVEMVVEGVSTRKVSKCVQTLCGRDFSKSTVSRLCSRLDTEVEAFRIRPLEEGGYAFLLVDATYFKVREEHRIVSKAMMVAMGIRNSGIKEIIGFGLYENESTRTWREFLSSLKSRGLKDPCMVISDAHAGLVQALGRFTPASHGSAARSIWQRTLWMGSRRDTGRASPQSCGRCSPHQAWRRHAVSGTASWRTTRKWRKRQWRRWMKASRTP